MQRMSKQGEQLAGHFLAHRKATIDAAGRFPADKLDYRPWPDAMSVGDLIWHMAGAHHMMVQIALGNFGQQGERPQRPADLDAIRAALAQLTEADAAAIRNMSEEDLAAPRPGIMNMTLPGAAWLGTAIDHEIHHKGLLFAYARLQGVEPPNWIKV
jgi:uncharacterized damage-inducible protein DinB